MAKTLVTLSNTVIYSEGSEIMVKERGRQRGGEKKGTVVFPCLSCETEYYGKGIRMMGGKEGRHIMQKREI